MAAKKQQPTTSFAEFMHRRTMERVAGYVSTSKLSFDSAVNHIINEFLDLQRMVGELDLLADYRNTDGYDLVAHLSDSEVVALCLKHKVCVADDLVTWVNRSVASRMQLIRVAYIKHVNAEIASLGVTK